MRFLSSQWSSTGACADGWHCEPRASFTEFICHVPTEAMQSDEKGTWKIPCCLSLLKCGQNIMHPNSALKLEWVASLSGGQLFWTKGQGKNVSEDKWSSLWMLWIQGWKSELEVVGEKTSFTMLTSHMTNSGFFQHPWEINTLNLNMLSWVRGGNSCDTAGTAGLHCHSHMVVPGGHVDSVGADQLAFRINVGLKMVWNQPADPWVREGKRRAVCYLAAGKEVVTTGVILGV